MLFRGFFFNSNLHLGDIISLINKIKKSGSPFIECSSYGQYSEKKEFKKIL